MRPEIFSNISKIIERDSKSTTYKYALLRGVIDVIQENSPYIIQSKDRVTIPLGLIIEKWLLYYYPLLDPSNRLVQIHGKGNLAFEVLFRKIIQAYQNNNGFSGFFNDFKNKGIPYELVHDFTLLVKKIAKTICDMPMKHIGYSISNNHYSIFQYSRKDKYIRSEYSSVEHLVDSFGTFSISKDYYEAFQILGSFITGQDSIIFKWAEFSVNASDSVIPVEHVIQEILTTPITKRDIDDSKMLYQEILKQEGKVYCVWTGKAITSYDVDHMIPFSVWRNNDLWNLLPSQKSTNNHKRDKIPSPKLIERRSDLILSYWNLLDQYQNVRFRKELKMALMGNSDILTWKETAVQHLQEMCNYLITKRGFEEWDI
ncbi:MAG: HNH endonuclease domain-containing protein [Bacteroidales bacterium]